jgi:hypothetical protein
MSAITDAEHDFSIHVPDSTAAGAPIEVVRGEREGIRRVHAYSPDLCEVYFEVVSYPGHVDHERAIAEQKSFLARASSDGVTTPASRTLIQALAATAFRFEGNLQHMYKVRRFVFVDSRFRTYRVVYDPRSEVNERILESLRIGGVDAP